LIAAPASSEGSHLDVLSKLARKIMHEEFRDSLLAQTDPAEIANILAREVQN
jgi:PTS system fructose-specific IIA component